MNLLINGTLYSLITINTGEYPEYAPGLNSLYYRMKHAADFEIRCIDMGSGDNGYKRKISNIEIPKKTLCFANPGSYAGKLYLQWLINHKRFERKHFEQKHFKK
jgi:CelD/BcsL family acetyltransferase involved in cellulose biosynthesis